MKKILLVEDEILIAIAQRKSLEEYGYEVLIFSSGEEVLDFFQKNKHEGFDLVLMDIDLGNGMNGVEAAKEILKICDIPIVFCSSHQESEMAKKIEGITYYAYIVKNLGITFLDESIKTALKLFDKKK